MAAGPRTRRKIFWSLALLACASTTYAGWLFDTNGWTSSLHNTLHLRTIPGWRYEIFRSERPGFEGDLWQVFYGQTWTNLITWPDLASTYPRVIYYSMRMRSEPGAPHPGTNIPSQPYFYAGVPCFAVRHTNAAVLAPELRASSNRGFTNVPTVTVRSGHPNSLGVYVIHYQERLEPLRFYRILLSKPE